MIIFLLILLVGVGGLLVHNSGDFEAVIEQQKKIRIFNYIYFVVWFLLFVSIAFRSERVGADTHRYFDIYHRIIMSESYVAFGGLKRIEPLYYYCNYFLSFLFNKWAQCVCLFEALLVTVIYAKFFKKYSIAPLLSLTAFMAFGLYLASLCLIRQTIAMALCVYALHFGFERKSIKFYMCILVAVGFHYTAIFWGFVYIFIVYAEKIHNKYLLWGGSSCIGFFITGWLQLLVSNLFPRWGNYSKIEEGAQGYISFVIFFLITISICKYNKEIERKQLFSKELMVINFLHVGLWMLRLVTRNAERLSFYYVIAPIILLPALCEVVKEKHGKLIGNFFCCGVSVCMIALFLYKYVRDASYYPYEFLKFD